MNNVINVLACMSNRVLFVKMGVVCCYNCFAFAARIHNIAQRFSMRTHVLYQHYSPHPFSVCARACVCAHICCACVCLCVCACVRIVLLLRYHVAQIFISDKHFLHMNSVMHDVICVFHLENACVTFRDALSYEQVCHVNTPFEHYATLFWSVCVCVCGCWYVHVRKLSLPFVTKASTDVHLNQWPWRDWSLMFGARGCVVFYSVCKLCSGTFLYTVVKITLCISTIITYQLNYMRM